MDAFWEAILENKWRVLAAGAEAMGLRIWHELRQNLEHAVLPAFGRGRVN